LPRISIARPFKTPESSAKTVDGSLPEAASGDVSRRESRGAATPKMVRMGDLSMTEASRPGVVDSYNQAVIPRRATELGFTRVRQH